LVTSPYLASLLLDTRRCQQVSRRSPRRLAGLQLELSNFDCDMPARPPVVPFVVRVPYLIEPDDVAHQKILLPNEAVPGCRKQRGPLHLGRQLINKKSEGGVYHSPTLPISSACSLVGWLLAPCCLSKSYHPFFGSIAMRGSAGIAKRNPLTRPSAHGVYNLLQRFSAFNL
jgi:hypothetical protein